MTTRQRMPLVAIGVLWGALAGLTPAAAEGYPTLSGEISIEIQDDYTFNSDDPDAELNDLYTTTEPFFSLGLADWLAIETGLVLEPVADPDPGDDRAFEDHGLYVEELYVLLDFEPLAVRLGKINPAFGIGWDATPGVYGVDFAEDYEVTERIGGEALFTFGGEPYGAHTLTGAVFFADTSFLSESAFENRGDVDVSDGGVSNTEDLSSFTVTLTGEEIPGLPGIVYHVGLSHQAAGETETDDESGLVAGLVWSGDLNETHTLDLVGEIAFFDNAAGIDGDELTYATLGAGLGFGDWNVAVANTWRALSSPSGDTDDYQFQVSAGYAFTDQVSLDFGYKHVSETGVDSDVVGFLVAYAFGFGGDD